VYSEVRRSDFLNPSDITAPFLRNVKSASDKITVLLIDKKKSTREALTVEDNPSAPVVHIHNRSKKV
jgi:hypothetical protein